MDYCHTRLKAEYAYLAAGLGTLTAEARSWFTMKWRMLSVISRGLILKLVEELNVTACHRFVQVYGQWWACVESSARWVMEEITSFFLDLDVAFSVQTDRLKRWAEQFLWDFKWAGLSNTWRMGWLCNKTLIPVGRYVLRKLGDKAMLVLDWTRCVIIQSLITAYPSLVREQEAEITARALCDNDLVYDKEINFVKRYIGDRVAKGDASVDRARQGRARVSDIHNASSEALRAVVSAQFAGLPGTRMNATAAMQWARNGFANNWPDPETAPEDLKAVHSILRSVRVKDRGALITRVPVWHIMGYSVVERENARTIESLRSYVLTPEQH